MLGLGVHLHLKGMVMFGIHDDNLAGHKDEMKARAPLELCADALRRLEAALAAAE